MYTYKRQTMDTVDRLFSDSDTESSALQHQPKRHVSDKGSKAPNAYVEGTRRGRYHHRETSNNPVSASSLHPTASTVSNSNPTTHTKA